MAAQMNIPKKLADIAATFPESSYGACRVTLVLENQKKIENVTLAWGKEIVKIGNAPIEGIQEIGFASSQIVGVLPE